MKLKDEIKTNFTGRESLLGLMTLNISVFLFISVLNLTDFVRAGSGSTDSISFQFIRLFTLHSNIAETLIHPWTILTYMFVHSDFMHLMFNMLVLYWTGRVFCDFLPQRKMTAAYVLGGLAGGFFYIAIYNLLPALGNEVNNSFLLGASAGVLSIMVAAATLAPDYPVHLLLFGEIRLKFIAIGLTILYLISIPKGNAGGNIAHLGGAVAGYAYIKMLRSGVDLGKWIEMIVSLPERLFARKTFKVVHRNTSRASFTSGKNESRSEVIDAILDKISRSGYQSLTDKEKETLFKASKKD